MKNLLSNLWRPFAGVFSKPWWVKVSTSQPECTYYFGPFDKEEDAADAKPGFVEDLEQEGAQDIQAEVVSCPEPKDLTVEQQASMEMATV